MFPYIKLPSNMADADIETIIEVPDQAGQICVTPEEILDNWIIQHNNTITQRSPEWYSARKLCVGGSAIATIMGQNPYENLVKFMRSKLGESSWHGDIKTEWGTMFEPVITKYVESLYNTVVKCDNYFVRDGPLAYSPDGIAVINGKIALLEFKCPYTRIPATAPPKYYIPQVKMGLEMLPLCEQGLFIEAVFRASPWHEIDGPAYVLIDGQRDVPNPNVLARGFIGITACQREDDDISTVISKFIGHYCELSTSKNIHDLSDIPAAILELILMSPFTSVYYSGDDDLSSEFNTFVDYCHDNEDDINIFGILPWKLLHLQQNIIDRSPGFLTPWMGRINDIIECVKQCSNPENKHKKENILEAFLEQQGFGFIEA